MSKKTLKLACIDIGSNAIRLALGYSYIGKKNIKLKLTLNFDSL